MSFQKFYPDAEFVVVFISLTGNTDDEYIEMNRILETECQKLSGYLGIQSVRDASGHGVTLSYWSDAESIAQWRDHAIHLRAKKEAQTRWYEFWSSYICKIQKSNTKS